jgi:hypothetical protein
MNIEARKAEVHTVVKSDKISISVCKLLSYETKKRENYNTVCQQKPTSFQTNAGFKFVDLTLEKIHCHCCNSFHGFDSICRLPGFASERTTVETTGAQ